MKRSILIMIGLTLGVAVPNILTVARLDGQARLISGLVKNQQVMTSNITVMQNFQCNLWSNQLNRCQMDDIMISNEIGLAFISQNLARRVSVLESRDPLLRPHFGFQEEQR